MNNFLNDIEKEMGETITHVVISTGEEIDYRFGEFLWDDDPNPRYISPEYTNRVLRWEDAREFLNYNYDTGYGGVDCHAVVVWSNHWVGFVGCYDGASWITKVPRHPTDHEAQTVGNG